MRSHSLKCVGRSSRLTRRELLAPALIGLTAKAERTITGSFVDNSHLIGHRLRDRAAFPTPRRTVRIPLVIVGGGIAGLSAAWRLDKRGFRDFILLEMESSAGGNSRWGQNEVSAYPWAAHYVPVPGKETPLARELMEELGVLRNGEWEELHLCHSPQERLFLHGRWQDGIEPEIAATRTDLEQYRRFHRVIEEFRASGAFRIPVEFGQQLRAGDQRRHAELDALPMLDWLRREKFDSPYLNWYIDYACRDDYGSSTAATSAWAGIHYFAARPPREEKGPLTWPEGNGWIVRRLLAKLGRYVRTGVFVHRIARSGAAFRVIAGDTLYETGAVIFAAPTHLAHYILEDCPPASGFQYSPWLTANLTLDCWPRERGLQAAWDNVIYNSPSLGYVVATHQSLRTRIDRTVWTYYWALASETPPNARRMLLEKDWAFWKERILTDLERAHPDIRECVSRVDIMRLGHAMIRPAPGFLFSTERRAWLEARGRFYFANSDLSGLSIFEEAQFRGVGAAERALAAGL